MTDRSDDKIAPRGSAQAGAETVSPASEIGSPAGAVNTRRARQAMTDRSVRMNREQTRVYDGNDDERRMRLMEQLRERARNMIRGKTSQIEIYTADGVVAEVVNDERARSTLEGGRAVREFLPRDRVSAGEGEDYDEGIVAVPTADALAMKRTVDAVWVKWDSGVSTWTPASLLSERFIDAGEIADATAPAEARAPVGAVHPAESTPLAGRLHDLDFIAREIAAKMPDWRIAGEGERDEFARLMLGREVLIRDRDQAEFSITTDFISVEQGPTTAIWPVAPDSMAKTRIVVTEDKTIESLIGEIKATIIPVSEAAARLQHAAPEPPVGGGRSSDRTARAADEAAAAEGGTSRSALERYREARLRAGRPPDPAGAGRPPAAAAPLRVGERDDPAAVAARLRGLDPAGLAALGEATAARLGAVGRAKGASAAILAGELRRGLGLINDQMAARGRDPVVAATPRQDRAEPRRHQRERD